MTPIIEPLNTSCRIVGVTPSFCIEEMSGMVDDNEGLRWLAGRLAWERRLAQLQENARFAEAIGQELPLHYAPQTERVGAAA